MNHQPIPGVRQPIEVHTRQVSGSGVPQNVFLNTDNNFSGVSNYSGRSNMVHHERHDPGNQINFANASDIHGYDSNQFVTTKDQNLLRMNIADRGFPRQQTCDTAGFGMQHDSSQVVPRQ